jgi:hypothetical protein
MIALEPGEDLTILSGPEPGAAVDMAGDAREAEPAMAMAVPPPPPVAPPPQRPQRAAARPSPLSVIRRADPARARSHARHIAPLVMQLKSLALRMAQD